MARDDMSCYPPQSGGHQLNGADPAPFGRGFASLAPSVGQNNDTNNRKPHNNSSTTFKQNIY